MHLVVSWVLMLPLFYYASVGEFWFQYVRSNGYLSMMYGSLQASDSSGEFIAIITGVALIVLAVVASRIRLLVDACLKNRVFAALTVLAMASVVWSQLPAKSLKWSLFSAIGVLLAYYIYQRFSPGQQLSLFMMLGWICLLFSIVLSLFFPFYGRDSTEFLGAWHGMYGNKNTCSMMTLFLLPAAFYASVSGLYGRLFRAAYIGLSILLVIMSQSATGDVLLSVLLLYPLGIKVVGYLRWKDKVLVMVALSVIALLVFAAGFSSLASITYFLGKDPTLSNRTEIWAAAMVSVMKRPIFGYGYVAFWTGYEGEAANVSLANGWSSVYAHSGYVNILTTLGVAGLGLFLWSLARALRDAMLCFRGADSPYVRWSFCIILLTIILNVDEVTIMVPSHLLWLLYMIACIGLSDKARGIRLALPQVEG